MNYESEFISSHRRAFRRGLGSSRRPMINLSSFIAFHARQSPERCALKYRGEEITYAAFHTRIQTVGGWLASRGIGPDDVIAVLMKNSAAFLDIAFAASHVGAILLPINFRLAPDA